MEASYYLRPNTVIEPIVANWYAHAYLISPGTAPMIIRDKIKLMRSFMASPELHELATKDSSVVGRTFLNVPAAQKDVVAQLLQKTIQDNEERIEFANSITSLYHLLLKEAKGFSLEGLYKNVPANLKGFVELVYDVNNQPGFRFFESMLYKSRSYDPGAQGMFFFEMDPVVRGNISDTPRIRSEQTFEWNVPFRHKTIDQVARLREQPQTAATIRSYFHENMNGLFNRFFTEEAPARPADANYTGDDIRIRYYGHACVLLQTSQVSILIDPFINYSTDQCQTNFTFLDLPDTIDYVLITHNHADHIIPEYLLQLRYKIKHIVVPRNGNGNLEDPSLRLMLENIGFESVLQLDELESIRIPDGEIIGMPFLGEHCDLSIRSKILHLVRLRGKSVLLASDSSNLEIEVYRLLKEIIGTVDIIFLGMESEGAPLSLNYGPFMTQELNRKMDQSRRVNGSDFNSGYAIVNEFQPKEVYVYAMGLEPWTKYILGIKYTEESIQLIEANKLIDTCLERGIHAELLEYKKELFLPAGQ